MDIKTYMTIRNLYKMHEGDEKKIVSSLLDLNPQMKLKDSYKMLLSYIQQLNADRGTLTQRFFYDGIEYGLIPDFEDMLTKEYLDIEKYEKDEDNIHRLMAVLYRPITESKGDKYDIEDYEGTSKHCDKMMGVDVNIYHNVIAFFLTLNQILLKDIQTSTEERLKKQVKKQKSPESV